MGRGLLDSMVGETCWHVSAGGATSPSFVLVLGDKLPRTIPLTNPSQPPAFRQNRGSVELLVWSSWRLQQGDQVLATSDQGPAGVEPLGALIGTTVDAVDCAAPAWDLRIRFSNGKELVTFSDHLGPDASIDANWELWARGKYLRAGPGAELAEEHQE